MRGFVVFIYQIGTIATRAKDTHGEACARARRTLMRQTLFSFIVCQRAHCRRNKDWFDCVFAYYFLVVPCGVCEFGVYVCAKHSLLNRDLISLSLQKKSPS